MKIYLILFLLIVDMNNVFTINEFSKNKYSNALSQGKRSKLELLNSDRDMSTLVESEDSDVDNVCDKKEKMVVYYNFESTTSGTRRLSDKSGCDNNGVIDPGSMITKTKSSCSAVIFLWNHDITIPSSSFQNPPRDGITLSIWLQLQGKRKVRGVFSAFGPHFGNLVLEINVPTVIWRFNDAMGKSIFLAKAEGQVTQKQNKKHNGWFHLAATYNAIKGIAQVYVNGKPIGRMVNPDSKPFKYWGNDVRIGGFSAFKPIDALIDEFKLFNYALSPTEIEFLSNTCQFNKDSEVSEKVKRDLISNISEKISNKFSKDADLKQLSQDELQDKDGQFESLIKEQFEKNKIPDEDDLIDNSDELIDPSYDQADDDEIKDNNNDDEEEEEEDTFSSEDNE